MERDAAQKAFARAWSYLNYNAAAKWAALLSAVALAVIYVALLLVLWLFTDLMVHRGQIPAFRDLSAPKQDALARQWRQVPSKDEADKLKSDFGIDLSAQPETPPVLNRALLTDLRDLGVQQARLDELARADPTKLPIREQELLWRVHLAQLLRQGVGGAAAGLVLPGYHDLPGPEQKAFAEQWKNFADRKALLTEQFGVDADRADQLEKADPATLAPADQNLLWRAWLYHFYSEHDLRTAAVLRDLGRADAAGTLSAVGTEDRGLHDRGLLSLVVRTHVQNNVYPPDARVWYRWNPYQAESWLLGLLAYLNPPMWLYGFTTGSNFIYYLSELLLLAVFLGILGAVLAYVMQDMAARASIEATNRLRRAVYHHTFRLGTLAFRALGPGEAVSIFTRHTEAVHDALYTWITVLFSQPLRFGLLLAFALVIHPLLALAFLLFALLVYLVGTQMSSYVRREGHAATNHAAEQLTLIRESLMLMRLVKCYLMELFNQSRVERQLARYAAAQIRRYRVEALYRTLLIFLGLMATVLLLYVAGLIVLHDQLSVASAIALAAALASLYWPLQSWLENRRLVRRGRESAVALFNFLDRPGEVGQVVGAEFLPPLGRELEFDNVSLREPGSGRMLLQDVSLTIKAGQRVGLVAADDLEKHALVYLLPRFLDPTSGEIRIDEHNLRWVTLDSLRAQTAVVMQHNLVFHDTVANNIGCGDPAYTVPQIIEAAKVAHAHHFIQKLPKGYETPIGELGHPLTVSEQFRIALARAILRDPALLIIEEPETRLDDDSKALVDDTFARVLPGRTAIFLPHRISTIRSCDRIFLLHKGRLEATGDHRGLLAQNPLYRHLHYLEFNEVEEQVQSSAT